MKLKLAISPCPNDTFIFDAMIHNKIGDVPFDLEVVMADIEELNSLAASGEVDICKVSYNTYPTIADYYQLIYSGSALGRNCGPILIANSKVEKNDFSKCHVAIPGKQTTANFLLSYAYPSLTKKTTVLFSEIEDAVVNQQYDLGVIIHENRFTYKQKRLVKIKDLGEHWESKTGHPIPLGGIVVRRDLSENLKQAINQTIRKSVEFAFSQPQESALFVRKHAQEMDEKVTQKHIDLYVNEYSVALGKEGEAAVRRLFEEKNKIANKPIALESIFINKITK